MGTASVRPVAWRVGMSIAVWGWCHAAVTEAVPRPAAPTRIPEPEPAMQALDPNAAPPGRHTLAPGLTLGASAGLEYKLEHNFDFSDRHKRDKSKVIPKVSAAASFEPDPYLRAFLHTTLSEELVMHQGRELEADTQLELVQAFLAMKDPEEHLLIQVGRQRWKDDRKWLFDDELDAIRLVYRDAALMLDTSVSRKNLVDRELLHGSEPVSSVINYLAYGQYEPDERLVLAAYGLAQDDRSSSDQDPVFLGIHAHGEPLKRLEPWLDLAAVFGEDGSKHFRGVGVDTGCTYGWSAPLKPALTLAYAFGSGDGDLNDGTTTAFRQTGFQDNSDKFRGVTRFKYYGELFDPELSNLAVYTAGFGIRPVKKSSIDLVYHEYRQAIASTTLRNTAIDTNPTGGNKHLGHEFDLVIGYRRIANVDASLILGYFVPGSAFSRTDNAVSLNAKVSVDF